MLKSGLIAGAVMLILGGILAFIFPLCIPCLALLAGAGAGYMAGMFDKPADSGASAKTGAAAGAVGGAGALAGHLVGGMINAAIIGPEGAADLMRQFGVRINPGAVDSAAGYYFGAFGMACCFGLFEIALMAGLGAVGGMIWFRMTGQDQAGGIPPAPAM